MVESDHHLSSDTCRNHSMHGGAAVKSFVTTSRLYSYLFRESRLLWTILAISLTLNLWGIQWGAPKFWHPDEITDRAISMVSARSINPHYFVYGGFPYYVVGAVAIVPVYLLSVIFDPPPPREDSRARNRWWQPRTTRIIIIARMISGVMSTAVVFLTFVIGKILFDKSSAYLAALFLSVSMSFVGVAHFATMDSPTNFWYWLSCVFALFIWKRGDHIWYALAAVTAGFAIGIKVDRLIILLPLLLSHFLRGEGLGFRRLITLAILVPAGYFSANPVLFTSTFEFFDGFTRDMFYQVLKGSGPEQSSYIGILYDMKSGLGLPLFLAALSGLAYGIYNLALNKNTAAIIWLLSTFLPYYFIFGSTSVQSWYLTFFFPPLMLLTAHACVTLINALPQRYAFVAKFAAAALVLYSFMYTVALIVQFSNDSRYLVADWIERNVPVNTTIEIGERGPIISEERYHIIDSLRDQESVEYVRTNRENLERYRPYQKVRQIILDVENWAGQNFGLEVRKQTYLEWFDNLGQYDKPSEELQSIVHQAEYIVLIEDLYPQKLRKLALPSSGYRLAAKYHFVDPFGLRPEFPFLNPPVYIFQRIAAN